MEDNPDSRSERTPGIQIPQPSAEPQTFPSSHPTASQPHNDAWCVTNSLDLNKTNLTSLRCDTLATYLQHLYLEGNLLRKLPEELFDHLPQLVWLDLRHNILQQLPSTIGNHRCLQTLLLERNPIQELPLELGKVSTLKAISLRNCPLQFPPMEVVHLGTQNILLFLREQISGSKPELQQDKPAASSAQKCSVGKRSIRNSLTDCYMEKKQHYSHTEVEPLFVHGRSLCFELFPKHIRYNNPQITRSEILQRSKPWGQANNSNSAQFSTPPRNKTATGRPKSAYQQLTEKQILAEQIQREKKTLQKLNEQRKRSKTSDLLKAICPTTKQDDKFNLARENIQAKLSTSEEHHDMGKKEQKISKYKNIDQELKHRLHCLQHQRRIKSLEIAKASHNNSPSANLQSILSGLSGLNLNNQATMEYRFCAFTGDNCVSLPHNITF